MKKVTIRFFQRNFYQALKELPLVITRYGKPLFKAVPIKGGTGNKTKNEAFK